MGKFKLVKKVDLSSYGEGSYLIFNAPTFKDISKFSELEEKEGVEAGNEVIKTLQGLFVEGKLPSSKGELVDVEKEDIGDVPIEVLTTSIKELTGQVDPNA